MSRLTLTQRAPTAQRLDVSALIPERLVGLSTREIASIALHVGNRTEALGELFTIAGTPGSALTIVPAADNLDRIGAGMHEGELQVDGDAGRGAAAGIDGGTVRIAGNAADDAGSGMRGGRLEIAGNAADRIGGPPVGGVHGMSGGTIVVHGHAGARAGERLRRGTVVIGGDAGDDAGVNMVAGTLAIAGTAGRMPGSGMRRGTILLASAPASLPATFTDNGIIGTAFLTLLLHNIAGIADPSPWLESAPKPGRRLLGDIGEGGMGEILMPA